MKRPEMLKLLRRILEDKGLAAAHSEALTLTETLEESAEELLTDVLQEILDEVDDTGTLFMDAD